ncbi:MAG: RNA-binding protein [Kastovskya adunca ATA6-11-RM4]|jgi:spoIIIJ-associated protein|nr:RNA-binding protein [Kastovskya adunca ATA6-11-RM4]
MSNQLMQRGQQWLEELLLLANLPTGVQATTEEVSSDDEPPSYWLIIDETKLTPDQIQQLIGKEGAALDALQYLANSILNLNQEKAQQASYTIELDGYRVRRQAELRALADSAAQKVRQTGDEFELRSLSSAERRQIHTFLKESEDLESLSRGQEPERCLVVRLRSQNE